MKKGFIYGPDGSLAWARHSALTPTPFLLSESVLRVYAGFRDERGVSRIGYVDVSPEDPSVVLGVSKEPALDVGEPGTFDDNGVILGDVLRVRDRLLMYYVGFQKVEQVKFLAFTGLAVSDDQGGSFRRVSRTPVLDRTDSELYIRAAHSVIHENGMFRVWMAGGSGWEWIGGKPFPRYDIRYLESEDGIHFNREAQLSLGCQGDEYRIGRPRVRRLGTRYSMYYTWGDTHGRYLPGYAESTDGLAWVRKDEHVGIGPSSEGWDSVHLCYPAPLEYRGKTYMFYNGNDMGRAGFGYAVLET
ncbi:MAG TPA: hypothetical protein VF950_22990 [Planctomycetota bacterium]